MAVYAAQIDIMDRGIGRILKTLRKTPGMYEKTMIIFLSDNGGCAEYLKENGEEGNWPEFYGGITRDGNIIQVGNRRDLMPGREDTFMSYDLPWANASNTPFRLFKSFVHEGGISTPFVVHWPAAIMSSGKHNEESGDGGRTCHSPWAIIDIVATCCNVANVPLPELLEGESFLPILHGEDTTTRREPIYFEHQGNGAVRAGKWKLVRRRCDAEYTCNQHGNEDGDLHGWELYNMDNDRTETNDLAPQYSDRVRDMSNSWKDWAARVGVKPWPLHPIPQGEEDWSNRPWRW